MNTLSKPNILEICKKGNTKNHTSNSCICPENMGCQGSNCDNPGDGTISNSWDAICDGNYNCMELGGRDNICEDCKCVPLSEITSMNNPGNNNSIGNGSGSGSGYNSIGSGYNKNDNNSTDYGSGSGYNSIGSGYNQNDNDNNSTNYGSGYNQNENNNNSTDYGSGYNQNDNYNNPNYLIENKISEFIMEKIEYMPENKEDINDIYGEFKNWYSKKYPNDTLIIFEIILQYFISKYGEPINNKFIINLKLKSKITTIEEETIIIKFISDYLIPSNNGSQISLDILYKKFQKWVRDNFDKSIMPSKEELKNKLSFSFINNNDMYEIEVINKIDIFSPQDKFNFLEFFDDKIIIDSNSKIHIDNIYLAFKNWMEINKPNELLPSKDNISYYLDSQNYSKSDANTWKGMKLIQLELPKNTENVIITRDTYDITDLKQNELIKSGKQLIQQEKTNELESSSGPAISLNQKKENNVDNLEKKNEKKIGWMNSGWMKYLKYFLIFIFILFIFNLLTGNEHLGTLYEWEELQTWI